MGIKNFLKNSGLITDDEQVSNDDAPETPSTDDESTPALTVVPGSKPPRRMINTAPLRTPVAVTSAVAPDAEIVTALQNAVAASTINGYEEFKTLFNAMDALPDAQRFTAALKALQAGQKITPAQVVQSIQNRLQLLESARQDFETQYEQQLADTVTKKQHETEAAADRIKQLRDEIQQLEGQRITLTKEAADAQVQLETERATFAASYEVVRSQLETENSKIAGFTTTSEK